ncbi:MAG: LamG-like jellyroll fold domain-containing protein, partial [Crocinitomicaceae bacterium]
TCRIGTGVATLGASGGSTGYYSWYDASTGGNYLGSGSTYITPTISSTTQYFVSSADINNGLNFDGANDRVAIQNYSYSSTGHTAITVEAWIRTSSGANQIIASFDRNEYWRLGVNGNGGGTGQIEWDLMTNSGQLDFGSVSTIDDGLWHHIAAVYDNGTASIYIDGQLDNQTTFGTTFGSGNTRFGFIGIGSEATTFNGPTGPSSIFNGDIEEVRIWSVARTQPEIQDNMYGCLTGAEAGLDIYYQMEDGTGSSTVTDLAGSNDGTMINMDAATDWIESDRDYYCESCESARTTVTATVSAGSAPDLGPDYFTSCGLGTINLDAGSGFVGYSWSTAEITQSINVSSPGTYWVIVDAGGGCFSSDTIVISEGGLGSTPTTPTANDTCRIGAGAIDLTASGSSGIYNWYDSPTGGNFLDSGTVYTTPVIAASTTYYVAAVDQNYGLNFDGSNDYVALNSFYQSTGNTEVTVEAWIRTTKTGAQIISSYDRSDYWRLGVSSTGGSTGQVTWSIGTDAGILDLASSGTVIDGNWHHVAGVYDNGNAFIYIDGLLDGTAALGSTFGIGSTRYGFIGTGSETASFNGTQTVQRFQGDIDEFRIWTTAKSQAEIQAGMSECPNGDVNGLSIYYSFQDGAGTTLTDLIGGQDGTMFNMDAGTDWIDAGYAYSCEACESPRTAVTVTISGGTPLDLGPDVVESCGAGSTTFDAGAGFTNYSWSTGATTQTINVSTPGTYWVVVDDGGGCADSDTVGFKFSGEAGTALNFDGANDYVAIDGFFYQGTSYNAVTVEAWVRTSNGANQIIASYDRNEYWRLGVNGNGAGTGQIEWDVRTNAGQLDMGSTTTINDGQWHHVVGVYDNGKASIYIDGVLDNQITQGTAFGTGNTRYGFVSIGSEATTFNGPTGPTTEFSGDIDEVRIWSIAKTETEIRNSMCTTFEGGESGLEVYYTFNDGSGSSVTDVANGNNGTMVNMSAGADWVTSSAPVGNSSTYLYPGSWAGQSLAFSGCDGDQIEISSVSGSLDGIHIYVVEQDPDDQSGVLAFVSGNHYYGVWQTGAGGESYDVSYIYTNHPLFTVTSENSMYLLDRQDAEDTPWVDNLATLSIGSDELNITYTGRKEIMLDSKEFIWTGNTSTDWNTGNNWLPTSVPPSGSDIKIPDVTNQPILDMDRQIGGLTVETGATVDLNGFNLSLTGDFLLDGSIISNDGTMSFNGLFATQNLMLNSTLDIDNMIVDNVTNVQVANGAINLYGTFSLVNGSFETNDSLTVVSNALGTGNIGEITSTGAITGDITMERYIDAGATYWHYFASPVQGATVGQYNDDFVTSGYSGSTYPSFSFTSVYTYDETFPASGDGWIPCSGSTQVMQAGQGLQIWCGDTYSGTAAFTFDVKGVPNQGNISIPVTFTSAGLPDEDGWNLVGNPYPSTIDWDDADWIKTNMANAIYVLNPDNEQYATYVAGASTNGGSQYIASQQAFWVYATSGTSALTATEGVKSNVDQGFFRSNTYSPGMTIKLNGNQQFDEAVMRHIDGAIDAMELDFDAAKWYGGWGSYPQLALVNQQAEELTVHSFDKTGQEFSIPLKAIVFQNGTYTIEFTNVSEMDVPCMYLEDSYSGDMFLIEEGSSFAFEMSDTTSAPRFVVHVGKSYDNFTTAASCFGESDGEIMLDLDVPSMIDYSVISNGNTTPMNGYGDPLIVSDLTSGIYEISVLGLSDLCSQNSFNFVINQPSVINLNETIIEELAGYDGSIEVSINGGTPPYSYSWNTGDATQNIYGLSTGDYTLVVTDAHGCETEETYSVGTQLSIDNDVQEVLFTYYKVNNQIMIQGWDGISGNQFNLYSAEGKLIQTYIIANDVTTHLIELPNGMESGIYFLSNTSVSLQFKFAY